MSGNWDTYFCRVDGNPASILVDLALADVAPLAAFPVMGYLSVGLRLPDEHGLPARDEYERLGALEDHLERVLTAGAEAVYAGRSATAGRFDCFFYLRDGEDWGTRAAGAMSCFPEYDWEAGAQNDASWQAYSEFLFPDAYAMHGIQNRRALGDLLEQGDDPEKSRDIEHWAVFAGEAEAGNFARAVREKGFAVLSAPSPAESGGAPEREFFVRFSRPDAPEGIDEISYPLLELALEHGGAYQGWACPVMPK